MPIDPTQERVLIMASSEQDAGAIAALLVGEGIETVLCPHPTAALEEIAIGAGALLMTEGTLETPRCGELLEGLKAQPAWSELPLIILTKGGESRRPASLDSAIAAAGGVILLERPMSSPTLLRSVQVALRSRRRQYQVRDLLAEQERQQNELRQSEQRYRRIIDTAYEGIWEIDSQGRTTYINQRMADLLGYKPSEIMGKIHTSFMWEEDRSKGDTDLEMRRKGDNSVWDQRYRRKDGSELWTVTSASSLYDETGVFQGALGMFTDITDRKQAEAAVRDNEERLRVALEGAALGTWDLDLKTNTTVRSLRHDQIWGYDELQPQWNYEGAIQQVLPEDRPMVEKARAQANQTGVLSFEARVRWPDGSIHWIALHGKVRYAEELRPRRIIGVVADITERKTGEEALRRSEERWNAAIEHLAEGAVIANESEQLIYWNPAARRIHGFASAQESIGTLLEIGKVFELWTPDGRRLLSVDEWPMRRIKRGETVRHLELRLRRTDQGWERIVSYSGAMVEMTNGERMIFLSIYDLTEQRKAEEALRENERRLALALEGGQMGMWEWHLASNQSVWNEKEYELLGLPVGSGRLPTELFMRHVHPRDAEALNHSVKEAVAKRRDWRHEFRIIRTDGQVRWLMGAARTILGPDGQPERLVGVNYDITERKEFQAELERLVTERTAKLQELVGELEHFSYTITHDMRAPLRSMRGFAELAEELSPAHTNADLNILLRRIIISAERMDLLITDALSYSQAVRQHLPLGPVDVGALLRGMVDSYPEFQLAKAHIGIESEMPLVLGNEAGLTQCFSNLIGNAIKFAKPGHLPDVRIWAEVVSSPEDSSLIASQAQPVRWIRICVEDKGIGISSGMLPRVFNLFARASNDHEGTGVGLALARKVVDRMGGRLGVESKLGVGSRFWVELLHGDPREPAFSILPSTPARPGAIL